MRPFVVFKDGKMGAIDESGKVKIPALYDSLVGFRDGLSPVLIEGKYGYIASSGEIAIPPEFDDANCFSCSLARVKKRGDTFFISTSGKRISDSFYHAKDFAEGFAEVQRSMTSNWGFIDSLGRNAIEPRFDATSCFSEGVAAVAIDWKWGFISPVGKFEILNKFTSARKFSEGLAAVSLDPKLGRFGFIDRTGELIIPSKFSGSDLLFSNGLAPVWDEGSFGFINKVGEVVIPYQFYDAKGFSEGRCVVGIQRKGRTLYGFIDEAGNWVVRPSFYFANSFENGLARVNSDPQGADEAWGYIDRNGKWLWRPNAL